MAYWVEANYFSRNRMKPVSIFVGPFDSEMDAANYVREKVTPEPNSNYKIHYSQHTNRDAARREVIFDNTDDQGLDNSLHPYYKSAQ